MRAPHAQGKAKELNWGRQKNMVARAVPGSWGRVVAAGEKVFWPGAAVSGEM